MIPMRDGIQASRKATKSLDLLARAEGAAYRPSSNHRLVSRYACENMVHLFRFVGTGSIGPAHPRPYPREEPRHHRHDQEHQSCLSKPVGVERRPPLQSDRDGSFRVRNGI